MADKPAKPKEALPFALFVTALVLGSVWNSAGGGFGAFGHMGRVLGQNPFVDWKTWESRLEELIKLPAPIKFPPQKIIPPQDLADAKAAMTKMPGPRPALATIGGEGKPNPFFPSWAKEFVDSLKSPEETDAEKQKQDKNKPKTTTPRIEEDQYLFTGIVQLKDDAPLAVLRDVGKNKTIFLKEGDAYLTIKAVKVELSGATFMVGGKDGKGGKSYSFDTLHGSTKAFSVRRGG